MIAIKLLIIGLEITGFLYYISIFLHLLGLKIYPFSLNFFKALIPFYYIVKYIRNKRF